MSEQPASGFVPDWTLGWRMQRALAHAEVSVEEIAEEIGVSRSTVRWCILGFEVPQPGGGVTHVSSQSAVREELRTAP